MRGQEKAPRVGGACLPVRAVSHAAACQNFGRSPSSNMLATAIVRNGGQESQRGWCKDRWGISWQITLRALTDALAAGGDEARVATIEAARRGLTGPDLRSFWLRVSVRA